MPSKRIYKEVKCANPECGRRYAPHDKRQLFCEPQCRINFNNDKIQNLNKGRYHREKTLRACDAILEMLLTSDFYRDDKIAESIISAFHVDPMVGSLEHNDDTGLPIFWFHAYGLELTDDRKRLYTIHVRTQ
jgi:hypothetical protein